MPAKDTYCQRLIDGSCPDIQALRRGEGRLHASHEDLADQYQECCTTMAHELCQLNIKLGKR